MKSPIVVMVKNNIYDIIGFMGVLYSGNYYVPVDSSMPKSRMDIIIKKLNPLLILHQGDFSEEYSNICIQENLDNECNYTEISNISNKMLDIDPAYVIFTSGSTGEPKGIVINHRSIIDLIEWLSETFHVSDKAYRIFK